MFACGSGREWFYSRRMFEITRYRLILTGLLVGSTVRLCAGDFAAPAEGPVAFRRDQVPLDVATMARLSERFSNFADNSAMKTAVERRGVAQMLALALALDPANTKARSLIENLSDGKSPLDRRVDPAPIEGDRDEVWQSINWLESPEAEGRGAALAAYLKDLAIFFDPEDPRAQVVRDAGEQGAWAGWIPPLAAYETKKPPAADEILPVELGPLVPPLATATLPTFVWKLDSDSDDEKLILKKIPIKMSAVKSESDELRENPSNLIIGSSEVADESESLRLKISQLLKNQNSEIPPTFFVTLEGDGLDAMFGSKRNQSINPALAVLASAAATGRKLGEVMIIGKVDVKGAFSLTPDFWTQLQSLGPGNGGRLVLPMAAAKYLPSMLALERQSFFLEHEVILASDFKELLDLTAETSDAALASASEQFQEIRRKGVSQPLGQYVATQSVRRRLTEITQQVPNHYSAKMLGIQGAGNRPTAISRAVLVAELRSAIEPMGWMIEDYVEDFEATQIEQLSVIYEACRVRVDGLIRTVDKADRELVSEAQDLIAGIRILDRAAKSRGDSDEVEMAMRAAQKTLKRSHAVLVDGFNRDAGDN